MYRAKVQKNIFSPVESRGFAFVGFLLILGGIIIVLGLILFGFLWYRGFVQPGFSLPGSKPPAQEPLPEEKYEITSLIGVIAAINDQEIIVKRAAEEATGRDRKGENIKIKVNENTLYSRTTTPAIIPPGTEDISALMRTERIGFADLKVGQEIVAISKTDISGQNEFTAVSIDLSEVEDVRSASGRIISLSGSTIVIKPEAEDAYYEEVPLMTVETDEETKFLEVYISAETGLRAQREIELSDLGVGDLVSLETRENIRGETSFKAQTIYREARGQTNVPE